MSVIALMRTEQDLNRNPATSLERSFSCHSPAAGELDVTMETSVPTTSRITLSALLHAEVLDSILVLVLEPGPGGITGSIILKGLAV